MHEKQCLALQKLKKKKKVEMEKMKIALENQVMK